jgi:hypothetical protein
MAQIKVDVDGANSGTNDGYPVSLQAQSTNKYDDVRALNPFQFVDDTYTGHNGYLDNTYLIPHPRESFYDTRRKNSYYINLFRPVVDAMVTPVFSSPVTRESDNAVFNNFLNDVDALGTDMNRFAHGIMCTARSLGMTFVVVDNYVVDPMPVSAVISQRKYPYIYERKPHQVKECICDDYGRATAITFCEGKKLIGNSQVDTYRYWDKRSWKYYYESKDAKDSSVQVVISEGVHGLGVLPVVIVNDFALSPSLKNFPLPPLLSLAYMVFGLYNKESQIVALELAQAFSLLVTSNINKKDISVGATSFLNIAGDAKFQPTYISPNTDNIRVLREDCERLVDLIYKIASQHNVIGVKDKESGIAKEWDFRALESVLKETAKAAVSFEQDIAYIVGIYIGNSITYEPVYQSAYSPLYEKERIAMATEILSMYPSANFKREIMKELAGIYFAQNKESYEAATEAILEEAEDEVQGSGIDGYAQGVEVETSEIPKAE